MAKTSNEPTDLPALYIKERMQNPKVKGEELAERMDTTPATVSRLLNAKRKMTLEWLYAFSKALNVPIESFFSHPQKEPMQSAATELDLPPLIDAISVIEDAIEDGRMRPKTAADKAEMIALLYAQRVSGNTPPTEQKPDNETGERGDNERQRKRASQI